MMADMVNHPLHYNQGKFEHVDVAEDWNLDYHLGNCTKYLMRAKHKGNEREDLQKARWYLCRRIEHPPSMSWWSWVQAMFDSDEQNVPKYSIAEVASDWSNGDLDIQMTITFIGIAATLDKHISDYIDHLISARATLDKRLKALFKDQP